MGLRFIEHTLCAGYNYEWTSKDSRTAVESKSNRTCNPLLANICGLLEFISRVAFLSQ